MVSSEHKTTEERKMVNFLWTDNRRTGVHSRKSLSLSQGVGGCPLLIGTSLKTAELQLPRTRNENWLTLSQAWG